jgi:hypothetical protein
MNDTITSTGGRAPPSKICRRLAEDLVRLAQLAVLAFQRLHSVGHLARDADAPTTVDLGLLDPLEERLRRAADL